jgi:hypothetical protein
MYQDIGQIPFGISDEPAVEGLGSTYPQPPQEEKGQKGPEPAREQALVEWEVGRGPFGPVNQ